MAMSNRNHVVCKWSVRILAGLLIGLSTSGVSYGVPASPIVHDLAQPDGMIVKARQWGDEWQHGLQTVTGYTIVKDQQARWVYARRADSGLLVPSQTPANEQAPQGLKVGLRPPVPAELARIRAEGYKPVTPSTGDVYVPVVLVNYSDTELTFGASDFDSLLFGDHPSIATGPGSMKDYYEEISYNQLTLNGGSGVITVDASGEHDSYADADQAAALVKEAVEAADAAGFDFSLFDNDGDGEVDAVVVIHQGTGFEASGDPTDIWSHMWSLSGAGLTPVVTDDGVTVDTYTIQPEILGNDISSVGVFCHEFGHVLGLPDLYDIDYSSSGVGAFCLMSAGSWGADSFSGDSPAHMCAWCKKELGWIVPEEIVSDGSYTIESVESHRDMYLLQQPFGADEYFLVENRQAEGFDVSLPGTLKGILIWHIDEGQRAVDNTDNMDETHYLVDLEEASGTQELEEGTSDGDDADYFRDDTMPEFSQSTTPDNFSYDGVTPCDVDIFDISASGTSMTFRVGPVPPRLTVRLIGTDHIYGTVTPIGGVYETDEVVTLIATPEHGYRLTSWVGTDDDTSTDNVNTVTMTNSKTVEVEFGLKPELFYSIDAYVAEGDDGETHGTMWPIDLTYLEGTVVVLSVEPDPGYQVQQWVGTDDDSLKTETNTVTMDEDKIVTVRFEPVASASAAVASADRGTASAALPEKIDKTEDLPSPASGCLGTAIPAIVLIAVAFLALIKAREE